jgi:hypothetical protein
MESFLNDSVAAERCPIGGQELPLEPASPSPVLVVTGEPCDSVVEAAHVYGPDDMIPVTNTDFVPEGFHENCIDELGGVKITEQNLHLYADIEHLIRIHMEQEWATEEGVTYTRDISGCPEGRAPTLEVLTSLKLRGYKLRGRIVMEGGSVMDCDTENSMKNLTQDDMPALLETFHRKVKWEEHGCRRRDQWKGRGDDLNPEQSLILTVDKALQSGIPSGTYNLKDITFRKNEEGLTCFSMCDEPKCCLMSHVMMMGCALGPRNSDETDYVMNFFRERKMFKKKDPVNGDIDICYHCLCEAGAH